MSQASKKGPVTPEMNITPLIDVVFLLIIFFMLVNNIVAKENVKMVVPKLDKPQTKDLGDINRIVINVEPEQDFDAKDRKKGNPLLFPGRAKRVKVGQEWFPVNGEGMKKAAEVLQKQVKRAPKDKDGNPNLQVLLRADAALYYSEVQPVMTMITAANVAKVNLVAFMPKDQ